MPRRDDPPRVTLGLVLRSTARGWRRDLGLVTVLAALVEAPVLLAELLVHQTTGVLIGTDEGISIGWDTLPVVALGLLAHHLMAGTVEAVEAAERHGHDRPPTLRALARQLPWGRLLVADVVLALATFLGLGLLVVPGVVVAVATSVTAPLLNMEGRSVVPTIRRSAQLVRGHPVAALVVWLATAVGIEAVEEAVGEAFESLTHSHAMEFVGHLVAEVVLLPLSALLVVMLAFELVAADRSRAPVDPVPDAV